MSSTRESKVRSGELGEQGNPVACLNQTGLFKLGPVAILQWRDQTLRSVELASENVSDLLGYPAEDFTTGRVSYPSIIAPTDSDRMQDLLTRAISEGAESVDRGPFRILRNDGSVRWVYDHLVFFRDGGGQVGRCCAYVVDVTDCEEARLALVHRDIVLSEAQAATHFGHWDFDLANDTAVWSDELYRLLGFEPGSVEANLGTFLGVVHPQDLESVKHALERAIDPRAPIPLHVVHRVTLDGDDVRYVEQRGYPTLDEHGATTHLIGVTLDVTECRSVKAGLQHMFDSLHLNHREPGGDLRSMLAALRDKLDERRRLQDALASSERRYRALMEEAYDAVIVSDSETGRILEANAQAARLVGRSVDELRGMHVADLSPPALRSDCIAEFRKHMQRGGGMEKEAILQTAGGEDVHTELHANVIDIGGQRVSQGIFRDVREKRAREAALVASEARLGAIFTNASAGLVETRMSDGRMLRVNPAFCALLGYSEQELLGMTFVDITHPADVSRSVHLLNESVQTGKEGFQLEKRYQRKDGTVVWCLLSVGFLRDDDGVAVSAVGMIQDLTQQKGVESELGRQNAILNTVAEVSELLLHGGTWESVAGTVLEMLGSAVGVSRVYVFENYLASDQRCHSRKRFEWQSPGPCREGYRAVPEDIDWEGVGLGPWHEALAAGRTVERTDEGSDPAGCAVLASHEIHAICLVPIFSGDAFWGLVGFDECCVARYWSSLEVAALRSAASVIGAAIGNQMVSGRLVERENRYALATQAGHVGVWEWDIGSDETYIDRVIRDTLGLDVDRADRTVNEWFSRVHPGDLPHAHACAETLKTAEPATVEGDFRIQHENGQYRWMRISAMRAERSRVDASPLVFGTAIDVTGQREIEEALKSANDEWAKTFDTVPDPVTVVDLECRIVKANSAFYQQLGRSAEDVIGMACTFCGRCSPSGHKGCPHQELLKEGGEHTFEVESPEHGGVFRINTAPLFDEDGKLRGGVHVAHDITSERRAERERLNLLERQKDTLILEVHHRIKNHLQGLIGLLKLRKQATPELAGPISEAINQVLSIATVYGLQSRTPGAVLHLRNMIEAIVENLSETAGWRPIQESFGAGTDGWSISSEKAVAVALVVNELLLNALKHADPQAEHEPVRVECRATGDRLLVSIRNAGRLPEGFDFGRGSGLGTGLDLVRNMLPRKGAQVTINDDGTGVAATLAVFAPLAQTQTESM